VGRGRIANGNRFSLQLLLSDHPQFDMTHNTIGLELHDDLYALPSATYTLLASTTLLTTPMSLVGVASPHFTPSSESTGFASLADDSADVGLT